MTGPSINDVLKRGRGIKQKHTPNNPDILCREACKLYLCMMQSEPTLLSLVEKFLTLCIDKEEELKENGSLEGCPKEKFLKAMPFNMLE